MPASRVSSEAMGYAEAVAIPLALLCTEPVVDEVLLERRALLHRRRPAAAAAGRADQPGDHKPDLPQARPAPHGALTHARLYLQPLRRRSDLLRLGRSGEKEWAICCKAVHRIVEAEGFKVHPDKTRVMRKSTRQDVTGLPVNEAVAVPRDLLRRYRAVLQQVERDGPAGKHFGPGKDRDPVAGGFRRRGRRTAARKKQPWYVTALGHPAAAGVMLAFAIRPGGAVIAARDAVFLLLAMVEALNHRRGLTQQRKTSFHWQIPFGALWSGNCTALPVRPAGYLTMTSIDRHVRFKPIRRYLGWCARRDSNPHDFTHCHLKAARLPIPPRALGIPAGAMQPAGSTAPM